MVARDAIDADIAAFEKPRAAFFDNDAETFARFSTPAAMAKFKTKADGEVLGPPIKSVVVQPEEIEAELRDYQLEWLNWCADRYERCGGLPMILGDEMGLGKTLQTISFIAWLKFEKKLPGPVLVICPLSVLSTWTAELARWCRKLSVLKVHATQEEERDRLRRLVSEGGHDVVVTTSSRRADASPIKSRRRRGRDAG